MSMPSRHIGSVLPVRLSLLSLEFGLRPGNDESPLHYHLCYVNIAG